MATTYATKLSDSEMLTLMRESKMGREMVAEIESAITRERLEQRREIDWHREELAKDSPRFFAATKKAEAKMIAAKKALEEASNEWQRAAASQRAFVNGHEAQISRLERLLRDSAPPMVDDFLGELHNLAEGVRRDGIQVERGPRPNQTYSNVASVRASLDSIADARQRAEVLKVECPEDFSAALAEIRAGITMPQPPEVR